MPRKSKKSPFDNYLPQGEEVTEKERRESYEKAVAERRAREQDKSDEFRQSLDDKRWLDRFKRVWQDGRETSTDK